MSVKSINKELKKRLNKLQEEVIEQRAVQGILKSKLYLNEYAVSCTEDELLRVTLDEAEKLTGSSIGFFYDVDEKQEEICLRMSSTNSRQFMGEEAFGTVCYPISRAGLRGDCVGRKIPLIKNDFKLLQIKPSGLPGYFPLVREAVIPIVIGGKVQAVLEVGNKEKDYDKRDLEMLSTLALLTWDIIQRKKAEEELAESKLWLERMFNSLEESVFIVTPDRRIVDINKATEKIFGYSKNELQYLSTEVLHVDRKHYLEFGRRVKKVFAQGQSAGFEFEAKRKNGEIFPTRHTVSLLKNDRGESIGIVSVVRDITERKQVEMELIKAKEEWERTFNAIPDIITIQDKNMRIVRANKAAYEALQFETLELTGKHCYEVFRGADKPCPNCPQLLTLEDSKSHSISISHENLDRVFKVSSSAILDDNGAIRYLVHVASDITERKVLESMLLQEQKIESIGSLAGGIAHDFNNILMGLFGNISLAKMELTPDHPAFEILAEAEKAMNRATRLTHQLLTFAEGGEPVKKDAGIAEIIKEIVGFDLSGSNVKPVYSIADDLWLAEVDKGQVEQAFSNLILNADQAMPEGGHLYISMENAEISARQIANLYPGKYIKVMIRDEGTGIDSKYLERIFDPYFSTKQTGRGLGLATVYSIINKHGGRISVNSKPGKGATFTLYLPASHNIHDLIKTEYPESTVHLPKKKNYRVLIMDDEETVLRVAEKMLTRSGFTVQTASNGSEAIDIYQKAMAAGLPFDIVILDLTVPGGMGGEETGKEILKIDPRAEILIMSGYTSSPLFIDYEKYGFKGKVEKPFHLKTILELLYRILR